MKNKTNFLSLLAFSSLVFATGCSENSNVPGTAQSGVQQAATTSTTAIPLNGGVNVGSNFVGNPFLQSQNAGYAQFGVSAQFNLQLQSQAMYTTQFRQNSQFYLPNYTSQNCQVRTQPTYTPTSCSCTIAPCNCQQVLDQYRAIFESTVTTQGSTLNTGSRNGVNPNSPTLFISITGVDARALYERLEVQADENGKTPTVLTGTNIKCMKDEDGSKDSDYACDLDVQKSSGVVNAQDPVSSPDTSVVLPNAPYQGDNVTVNANGQAMITITGKAAEDLYAGLTDPASESYLPSDPGTSASSKTGKQIECYRSVDRHPITECTMQENTSTGEILNVQSI